MADMPVVTDLLRKHKVTAPAVNVNRIIEESGVRLVFEVMDDSDSGLLLIKGGEATIAINAAHHPNRRRFSAAHECGHYFLHREGDEQLFVDQAFQRDATASSGTNRLEIEANRFAAELLMPETMIRDAVANQSLSDLDIALLALRFEVSEQAMTLRLVKLSLIDPWEDDNA
jgi:Zn-dependent peptidase ImmA (M78 family)